MSTDFSVVAIIAAYNEEDIIGQVIADLIEQGVRVYLLDHASTDGTVAQAERYVGRGLLRIERLPEDPNIFALAGIVRRKEVLARELEADWFINADADEFRESPWAHRTLSEAIQLVDRLGHNAIDFELLNFWPTHDDFRPGDDVRASFRFYEPGQPWDKVQIRCWKKIDGPVDLVSTGGHEPLFPGRKVFPIRFLLRHYPIRSQAHGERKVFRERRPRFSPAERDQGWHVQYDAIGDDHRFIRDPATLIPYDPDVARLRVFLEHRDVEELRAKLEMQAQATLAAQHATDAVRRALEQLGQELEARGRQVEQLREELQARVQRAEELDRVLRMQEQELRGVQAEVNQLGQMLGAAHARIDALHASRSWRWTAPLRAGHRLLRRG